LIENVWNYFYLRVSTVQQGRSGLGLEAQREAVARFAAAEVREVLAEFVEVETGKGSDALDRRPKLAEALAKAKKAKAPVVVAKLRRGPQLWIAGATVCLMDSGSIAPEATTLGWVFFQNGVKRRACAGRNSPRARKPVRW
jgi:Resolvase, N terminal domain